jgi:Transposase DDE domain group 1
VRWYLEKAGTIECVHDVSKNDLAAGMPPSGKFGANAAWYRLNLLTYNVLIVLRRLALPERFRHARPKRLRYEVFTLPAEIHTHARQLTARLGVPPLTVDALVATWGELRDLRTAIYATDSAPQP